MSKRFNKKPKYEVVNNLDCLAAHARSTWKAFRTDVLTKAWTTKTNMLTAIVKAKASNNFKLPKAKDLVYFHWDAMCEEWKDKQSLEESKSESEEVSQSDQQIVRFLPDFFFD